MSLSLWTESNTSHSISLIVSAKISPEKTKKHNEIKL